MADRAPSAPRPPTPPPAPRPPRPPIAPEAGGLQAGAGAGSPRRADPDRDFPPGSPVAGVGAAQHVDVVVVGAGPAGLAAARAAVDEGASVLLLDDAPVAGGQVWRARRGVPANGVAEALADLARAGVTILGATRVVMPLPERTLLVEGPGGARRLRWSRLVIAAGARERLLPFPGWTLPGVFGAGGLQALVKGGWPVAGRRVVVAGSGPLLLAAAATLRREGARLVAIVEEAPKEALARFAGALAMHPPQVADAVRLARQLWGVPWITGTRVVAAEGDREVERVILGPARRRVAEGSSAVLWHPAARQPASAAQSVSAGERASLGRALECDLLAAGWGLLPRTELAESLGCALAARFGARAVEVDAEQRTSVAGVFASGECTGVAGMRAARLQGRLAGAAAARDLRGSAPRERPATDRDGRPASAAEEPALRSATRRLAREYRFARALARTFPAPGDIAARLRDDTLVCRCEDVPWSALRDCADLRSAKLATRCGMGHCQGALCHDAMAAMMGWPRLPPRLPLVPIPLRILLEIDARARPAADPSPETPPPEETSR